MVAASLVLAICFDPSQDSPQLLTSLEGVSILAFESRTVDTHPDGSLHVSVDSPKLAVKALSVDTIGASGKVQIEIAILSGKPSGLALPPTADIYQYIQIANDTLESSTVATVTVDFEVIKEWIDSHGYADADVVLERYSGSWEVTSIGV